MFGSAKRLFLAIAIVSAFGTTWALAGEPMLVGQVARIQGSAQAIRGDQARALKAHSPVYLSDRLTTGPKARLLIVLEDRTEVTLGGNAELVIDRFVYDPDRGVGSLLVGMLKGAFLLVGGLIEDMAETKAEIATQAGVIGIRGTTVWGGVIDGDYSVLVVEGTVTVSNPGGQVTVGAGNGTIIPASALAPEPPRVWPDEKIARAFATVSFDP